MSGGGTFVYDEVQYPAPILEIMAPERLRAASLLHGMRPPEVGAASLLEIGCGDGINAIAFAAANPAARVVGFDLSETAIERGRALIALAELDNVELHVGDITTWPRDGVPFDYITCHGVLSWIPAEIQPALLDLIGAALAPGGVAYVSHDALPGAAPKRTISRFLRKQLRATSDPRAMMEEFAELVGMLHRSQGEDSALRGQLEFLRVHMDGYDPNFFFHDWLAEHYHPLDPGVLRAELGARNLRLAGSAACYDLDPALGDDPLAAALLERMGDDAGARLEAIDILDGGLLFHRDLIVRTDSPPPPAGDGLTELAFSYEGTMEPVSTELGPGTRYVFPGGATVVTLSETTRAVIGRLVEADFGDVSFAQLLASCGLPEAELRTELFSLCATGAVRPHAGPQRFVRHPGERPTASSLVRAMMARGTAAATLRSSAIVAPDNPTRYCLALCDGTRTRAEIAEAVSTRFKSPVTTGQVSATVDQFARAGAFEA